MKSTYALGWKELRAAEDLAAKAQELFPDRLEPEADRQWMRDAWVRAVRTLRAGPGFLMDQRVERLRDAEAA